MEDNNFVSLDACFFKTSEVDPDYEFDAARFFDFTRPESSSEAEEAERWLLSIGSYQPSPFALRLYGREYIKLYNSDAPPNSNHAESVTNMSTASDADMETKASSVVLCDSNKEESYRTMDEDFSKTKSKTSSKSSRTKNSTLMKPTASHLAKINHAKEEYGNYFGRSDKSSITSDDRSSRSSQVVELTKRQRLENGYLRKTAKLKHQNSMSHKVPKVQPFDASILTSKPKVTKPIEPNLETAVRAQRQRLKNTIETGEHSKEVAHVFKARPLNRKIFKTPSHRSTKNNTASPVIQSCNTASTECATDALSEDSTSKNGKFEVIKREASCLLDIEELSLINNNILSHNPPTELFDKLSLQGDSELITVSGRMMIDHVDRLTLELQNEWNLQLFHF